MTSIFQLTYPCWQLCLHGGCSSGSGGCQLLANYITNPSCIHYRVLLLNVQFKVDDARPGGRYLQLRVNISPCRYASRIHGLCRGLSIYIGQSWCPIEDILIHDKLTLFNRLHITKTSAGRSITKLNTVTYRGSRPEVARKDSQTYVDVAVISICYWVAIVGMKSCLPI